MWAFLGLMTKVGAYLLTRHRLISFRTSTYQSCEQHLSSGRWCFWWQLPCLQIAWDVVWTFTALSSVASLSTSCTSGVKTEDMAPVIQIFNHYCLFSLMGFYQVPLLTGMNGTNQWWLKGFQKGQHSYFLILIDTFMCGCHDNVHRWKADGEKCFCLAVKIKIKSDKKAA